MTQRFLLLPMGAGRGDGADVRFQACVEAMSSQNESIS